MKRRDQRQIAANLKLKSHRIIMNSVSTISFPSGDVNTYQTSLLPDDTLEFYYGMARSAAGSALNKNLYEVQFSEGEIKENEMHMMLHDAARTNLHSENFQNELYDRFVGDDPDSPFHGMMFLFSFTYSAPSKDDLGIMDGESLDFNFVIGVMCPAVAASAFYVGESGDVKAAGGGSVCISPKPISGFMYPSFYNGMSDMNHMLFYTKKKSSDDLMQYSNAFGTSFGMTCTEQRDCFNYIVRDLLEDQMTYSAYINIISALETMRYNYDPSEDDAEITSQWIYEVLHRMLAGSENDVTPDRVDEIFEAYAGDNKIYVSAVFNPKVQIDSDGISIKADYDHAKPIKLGKLTDGYEISAYAGENIKIGETKIY